MLKKYWECLSLHSVLNWKLPTSAYQVLKEWNWFQQDKNLVCHLFLHFPSMFYEHRMLTAGQLPLAFSAFSTTPFQSFLCYSPPLFAGWYNLSFTRNVEFCLPLQWFCYLVCIWLGHNLRVLGHIIHSCTVSFSKIFGLLRRYCAYLYSGCFFSPFSIVVW